MSVGKKLKTFGAYKMIFNVRAEGLSVKRELDEEVVVPMLLFGAETWIIRLEWRHKVVVREINLRT